VTAVFIPALATLLDAKDIPSQNKAVLLIASAVVVFLATVFGVLILLKPYTSFDTRRNETMAKRVNWILLGLLGFFLFTVLGVYFRQKIFGF
jgi:hypothetical protein